MPNFLVPVVRAQNALYPHVGGVLVAIGDGRNKPNLPDGVLKRIGNGGLTVQVGPHAQVLAEVDTATRAFVQTLAQADQLGTDVSLAMDEYFRRCGNEPWPLPKGWFKPRWLLPVPPGEPGGGGQPEPSPWLTQQMRIIVALTLTELGDQLDSDFGTSLIDRAGQLFDAATATNGG